MAAKTYNIVRGKRLRVTRLKSDGTPLDPGEEEALVVTKGFVSVTLSPEVEDGEDITQMNADGDLCVSDRSRDQFRYYDVEVELCNVDPGVAELMTNATLEENDAGDVVGIRVPEGASEGLFALELWAGSPQYEPTENGNGGRVYGYLLLPHVVPGTIGEIEVENGTTTFTMRAHTAPGAGWGEGPEGYEVVEDESGEPAKLSTPIAADEHLLIRSTSIAPPDVEIGLQPMPNGA